MKTWLLILALACFFGEAECQQYTPGPSMIGLSFPEHPQTATYVQLPNGGGASVTASGEQTSNFPSPHQQESLGDAARRLKAEHTNDKKAATLYTNQ